MRQPYDRSNSPILIDRKYVGVLHNARRIKQMVVWIHYAKSSLGSGHRSSLQRRTANVYLLRDEQPSNGIHAVREAVERRVKAPVISGNSADNCVGCSIYDCGSKGSKIEYRRSDNSIQAFIDQNRVATATYSDRCQNRIESQT